MRPGWWIGLAAGLLAGLLAGWALWGRGPDLARIRADNAALEARVAARESTVAQLARLAVQLDVARHQAVSWARTQRDTIRLEVARADSAQAEALGQLAQGDSAGAIAPLTLATQLLDRALARCESALDSLEQAATTLCDRARAADSAALAACSMPRNTPAITGSVLAQTKGMCGVAAQMNPMLTILLSLPETRATCRSRRDGWGARAGARPPRQGVADSTP